MPKISVPCPYCNKPFQKSKWKHENGKGPTTCSRSCGHRFYLPVGRNREDRFFRKVKKTDTCWVWTGATLKHFRYGLFFWDKHNRLAHRASWIIANGPIPGNLFVCHKCDNPPCVNPEHLFLGTNTENIHDAQQKGRMAKKLSSGEVEEIKVLADAGSIAQHRIAARYGITQTMVSSIKLGKCWRLPL